MQLVQVAATSQISFLIMISHVVYISLSFSWWGCVLEGGMEMSYDIYLGGWRNLKGIGYFLEDRGERSWRERKMKIMNKRFGKGGGDRWLEIRATNSSMILPCKEWSLVLRLSNSLYIDPPSLRLKITLDTIAKWPNELK